MRDDLLFKKTCKVLLSLLFILLISRIDKSPLDTPSSTGVVHSSLEVSFIEKSSHTVDTSLFLIPLYFDPFTTQPLKHPATVSSIHPNLIDTETAATIFCKYICRNRSNKVLTKVLLI
ncbi:MAG: hypothetical protein ACM31E_00825 [Fibrobacterota bacterium]